MRFERVAVLALFFTACVTLPVITGPGEEPAPVAPEVLRAPEDFAKIPDATERSRALFAEAGKVLTHARCTNCHPAGDSPTQGAAKPHDPPVTRGAGGFGTFLVACHSCHQDANGADAPIPGAPLWHLAPREMGWAGVTLAQLCAQLKDPARNGGRDLQQIVQHSANDPLVGWGWNPGPGRAPVPGTQERFGALLAAWAEAGAACPD